MSDYIDPKQFIITRKRKKYKFAQFANSSLCFEYDQWDTATLVDCIEIGAGTGLLSVEWAARHPDEQFVALDVKGDRLQVGAREAEKRGISNVRFLRARADQIDELFLPQSVRQIWATFSDPFPKKRSSGRRLTHPMFLKKYHQLLADGGALYIKHDNPDFFQWSLEQLVTERWGIDELSFDLHESELSDEYKILTTYEQRWLHEGRITQFVKARKQS